MEKQAIAYLPTWIGYGIMIAELFSAIVLLVISFQG